MKTVSIFLALINSLLAGLVIMYNLSVFRLYETGIFWLLVESLIDLSIILISALTWFACMKAIHTGSVLISGLYLVVLGAVTIVWTYHLAVLSGTIEYTMAVFGGSIMMQGLSSLLGFSNAPMTMTVS
jgi:hypothetical protein